MTIDKGERETLHFILDYLLNARQNLEKIEPEKLHEGAQVREAYINPRHELIRNAAIFLRRVVGHKLHQELLWQLFETKLKENHHGPEVPIIIANSIRVFLPLFMKEANYAGETFGEENIEKILDDLNGIVWGDEPRFFAIARKKTQGSHKRPYRLARLRLAALEWDKYLEAVGVPAYERHGLIAKVFKTEWDTIRKWAKPMQKQFGLEPEPPYFLEDAKRQYAENPSAVYDAIQRDGDAYWQEKSITSSGKRT